MSAEEAVHLIAGDLHVNAINVDMDVEICSRCRRGMTDVKYAAACRCIVCFDCISSLRHNIDRNTPIDDFVCDQHPEFHGRLITLYSSMCGICQEEGERGRTLVYTICGHVFCLDDMTTYMQFHDENSNADDTDSDETEWQPPRCPTCRHSFSRWYRYLPLIGPPETREIFRPHVREATSIRNEQRHRRRANRSSRVTIGRRRVQASLRPARRWTQEDVLEILCSNWELVQAQYACLPGLLHDTSIIPLAYGSYRSFERLMAIESLAQLENGGDMTEDISTRLRNIWLQVERDTGGFEREDRCHVRLRMLLTQMEQTQLHLREL